MEKTAKRDARKPPKKITESYLHNAGLHYLQRFATSSGNFRRVMMRKVDKSCRHHADQDRAACVRMIETLIEKFTRSGLLNDEVYARGAVSSLRRRGESTRSIEGRLSAKGLDRDRIRGALQAATDGEEGRDGDGGDFNAALRFARRRRIGPFRTTGREPNPEKEMATMARGGYSYELARRILGLSGDEASDLMV